MNKEKARENSKRYYYKHKEQILARQKEYVKSRYKYDEEYRQKKLDKNKKYEEEHYDKIKESKRKAQAKYIDKKRLNGEIPITKEMTIKKLQQENKQLKEKYNKVLRILDETQLLPCESFEDYFDCTECDYCNNYCSNADLKCWDNFIENYNIKGDSNEV